jgi:hypothetical protein
MKEVAVYKNPVKGTKLLNPQCGKCGRFCKTTLDNEGYLSSGCCDRIIVFDYFGINLVVKREMKRGE